MSDGSVRARLFLASALSRDFGEGRGFSGALAQAHLTNLAGLGPRVPESEEDAAARGYLAREFQLAGVTLETLDFEPSRHLVDEIPGASGDAVLLVAPYSALGSDRWIDDSGAVLLLELTRVLSGQSRPCTVRVALADRRPGPEAGADEALADGPQPPENALARRRAARAGASLASALEASGGLTDLRVVIAFELRAGAEPRIARDLRSHPVFSAVFWAAEAALDHSASFPPDAGWRSSPGLQGAFRERGLGQVLALVDETIARAELQAGFGALPQGRRACAVGLEPVGSVTLGGLKRQMRRFERADAFPR